MELLTAYMWNANGFSDCVEVCVDLEPASANELLIKYIVPM